MKDNCSRKITLIGFYGRGNFGDDIMCEALRSFVEEHLDADIAVISSSTGQRLGASGQNVSFVSRRLDKVLAELLSSDVLCQGGGTIFHDSYKGRRLYRYWLNLLLWAALFWVARLCQTKVVMIGAGVGPLTHIVSRMLARLAFGACHHVGVRDFASLQTLKSLVPKMKCDVGFDLAALMPASESLEKETQPIATIAISACSLSEFLGNDEMNLAYWQAFGDGLADYCRETPMKVVFLSLFAGISSEPDSKTCQIIAERLPLSTIVEHRVYSGDAISFSKEFAKYDYYVCTKYHAALLGFLYSANMAVISYNRKINDLADEVGLPSKRRVAIDKRKARSEWSGLLKDMSEELPQGYSLSQLRAKERAEISVLEILKSAGLSVRSSSNLGSVKLALARKMSSL